MDTATNINELNGETFKVPPTIPAGASEEVSGSLDALAIEEQKKLAEAQKVDTKKEKSITDLMTLVGSEGQLKEKELQTLGYDEAKRQSTALLSKIQGEELSARRKAENILRNNPTGALRGGQADLLANIERESLSKRADLAVEQMMWEGRYKDAEDIAARKVALQLEPIKTQLETEKFLYENNKEKLTKAEDRIWSTRIEKNQREYEDKKKKEELLSNTKLSIMQNAQANGAPSSVLSAITKATDPFEVMKVAGSYGVSVSDLYTKAQIADIKTKTSETGSGVTLKTEDGTEVKVPFGPEIDAYFPAGTEENALAWIKGSAGQKGNLEMGDREKIEKINASLSGVESLNGLLISSATEGKEKSLGRDLLSLQGTGPVTGRARKVLTLLGQDADAAAINAAIQGLIPTVARGIFGEVGVLTDADIENYKKTVPNMTSTEAQNKAISMMLMSVLSNSLESKLTTAAKGGKDVSNYAGSYVSLLDRIEKQKIEMGITGLEDTADDELGNTMTGKGNTTGTSNLLGNLAQSLGWK